MDACCEIVITRPRAAIAAMMFDPAKAHLWSSGVIACRPLTAGPIQPGSRVEQVSRVFGLRTVAVYEVVSLEPERFLEIRLPGPFDTWCLHELEDCPDGTLVRIRTKAVGGDPGFFRKFGALLRMMTRYNLRRDLRKLKRVMEAGPI